MIEEVLQALADVRAKGLDTARAEYASSGTAHVVSIPLSDATASINVFVLDSDRTPEKIRRRTLQALTAARANGHEV